MSRRVTFLAGVLAAGAAGLLPTSVVANSITSHSLAPAGPAVLQNGADVAVSFAYRVTEPAGVRIFVRPTWHGELARSYGASGSPVYQQGSGRGESVFTIGAGLVDIDGVRFQIVRADDREVLYQQTFPARFRFAPDPLAPAAPSATGGPVLRLVDPNALPRILPLEPSAPARPPPGDSDTVIARSVRPDGSIEFRYADGTTIIHELDGSRTRINPDGTALSMLPVTLSPVPLPASTGQPDAAWVAALNTWLETMGERMLDNIEHLAGDPTSFANYQSVEDENADSLYERVDFRQKFLARLGQ